MNKDNIKSVLEKVYAVDKREARWMADALELISSAIHHAYNSGYLEGWKKGKEEMGEQK